MDTKNIIQNALSLTPAERLFIIETLSKSLSEPDKEIDNFWKEEVERRYELFIKGQIKTIPYEDIIKK
ncbi:MAG: addiction module protein [Ignavibacteriaceae bacterium]|jgi:putative addiction module component (TIGR02574 family)